jgi:hypothetical protein
MLEVKHKVQTKEPKKGKKVTRAYINEVTHGVSTKLNGILLKNFVQRIGWEFKILNEEHILEKTKILNKYRSREYQFTLSNTAKEQHVYLLRSRNHFSLK